ncbi:MAG: asparagine synthase (glutamine-hydrolyzing) [Lachnospiraceae bacterium]|nr:asparagine synthase (glutamine-hydrolyzing) [Lachnospiraceae bacterium]
MCGIFGAVNADIEEGLAGKCLDTLIHRGPDDRGLWQEKGTTMGQRRLAILDLSQKGHQPMFYADGRYVLVYNGEIYNFLEIRDELISRGYTFESESDSEVLLAAYLCYGEECLKRFNGMWAFLIYDRAEERMFISRDRFGIKPLYYTRLKGSGNSYAFASEMKALMPLLDEVKPNMSIVTDRDRIVYYESTEECVIEGISRFPAGSFGYADKNGLRIKRWWNTLDNLVTDDIPEKYEDQVLQFRELFLDACKLRMRADVTIGTALSGGLDSSSVISAMAHIASSENSDGTDRRISRDWQHAYVASFPGTTMDETAYAKAVTDHLGIPSTFVVIDPLKAIDRFDEMIYLFEDIYLTSPIPMMTLYGTLKKEGTTVTIDGHGADELFGGYTFDFIHALKDAGNKAERDMILNAYIDSFPKNGSNMALKSTKKSQVYFNYLKRNLREKLKGQGNAYKKVRDADHPEYQKMDTLNKRLYASSHENILPTLLRNYDRYSMANSVEIRMPFMDHRIVSYAMSIGFRSKLHGGYSKSIIRDAMAPFMPHEIAYRKTKIGFNSPIVEWMQGPLKEYFLDTVSGEDFRQCGLIDPADVREKVMKVIGDRLATVADGEIAFSALYPYLWEKNVIKHK